MSAKQASNKTNRSDEMANQKQTNGRVIQINAGVIGPSKPQPRLVKPKKIFYYPEVPKPYRDVAQRYTNPLLFGPPVCDELMALVQHMFTEEEAALVRHLSSPRGKNASAIAAAEHRPVKEVRPILDRLADEKHILLTHGQGKSKRYGLMPIVPGVFESVLVRTSLDTLTSWHRRFAELFEALFATGYLLDYAEHDLPAVRYLPVERALGDHSMALPSDRLEEVLDHYKVFALGLCQCRMTEEIVGRGCDRSLENCVAFGDAAEYVIRSGRMRRVTKQDVLEVKAEAEANGLVTCWAEAAWGRTASGASCSCCGCCCHALQTITRFNVPGLIAPPHFTPRLDDSKCNHCGKCARNCPLGAIVVDTKGKNYRHLPHRCIGCGLCSVACDRQKAIQMEPVADYREPPRQVPSILRQMGPNYLRNAWSVWRSRR
jgi:ferredoxin